MNDDALDRLADAIDASREAGDLPPDTPLEFGPFRLLKQLGAGRFGVVYLAEDTRPPGRVVALKLPQSGVMRNPELARRFRRDAEAAMGLDHPGLVPIHEAGTLDGVAYLVMPYVAGPTLAGWLAAHPGGQPAPIAVTLVLALADAVQYANERGVLHCDLKPANVLLSPKGTAADSLDDYAPRVADFGLARLLDSDATVTQAAFGSPPYMAPEQALGQRRDLTARCDVHALAAILYELLSGTPPHRDLSGEPAPLRGGSRDLAAVVRMGMEWEPKDRYASAAEFADDLSRWQQGRPTRARPVGPVGRAWLWARRRPLAAAVAVLVVFALGMGLEVWRARDLATGRDFYHRLERVRRRAVEKPDGWADDNLAEVRALAKMSAARDELPELRTQAATALAEPTFRFVRVLAAGKNAYVVAFSPDGRTVALGESLPDENGPPELRVWLVDPETGQVTRVLTFPVDWEWDKVSGRTDGARSILYGSDGRWLAVGTKSGRVTVWALTEPEAKARARHFRPHGRPLGILDEIASLITSADGQSLFVGDRHQRVVRWDLLSDQAPDQTMTGRCAFWRAAPSDFAWFAREEHRLTRWLKRDLLSGTFSRPLPAVPGFQWAESPCGELLA